eukprot:9471662-Pyramimonas_sp.AAC.2
MDALQRGAPASRAGSGRRGSDSNNGGTFKYSASKRDRALKPGEWSCPSCGFDNFASRAECFKCGQPK